MEHRRPGHVGRAPLRPPLTTMRRWWWIGVVIGLGIWFSWPELSQIADHNAGAVLLAHGDPLVSGRVAHGYPAVSIVAADLSTQPGNDADLHLAARLLFVNGEYQQASQILATLPEELRTASGNWLLQEGAWLAEHYQNAAAAEAFRLELSNRSGCCPRLLSLGRTIRTAAPVPGGPRQLRPRHHSPTRSCRRGLFL